MKTSFLPGRPTAWAATAMLTMLPALGGCNILGAISLFNYQFIDPLVPEPEIEARYKLPDGKIAVIVESRGELGEEGAPKLPDMVAKRTVEELRKNVKDRTFVPHENVSALRHRLPGRFARMSNTELANRLHADTLVMIELHGYRKGSPELGDKRMGNVQVLVRVMDGKSDDNVLWPEGQPFEVFSIATGVFNAASEYQNEYAILDAVADRVGERVSKYFYTYRPPKHDIGDRPD